MRLLLVLLIVAAMSVCVIAPAEAAIIVADNFSYGDGSLTGNNGGTSGSGSSWTTAWTMPSSDGWDVSGGRLVSTDGYLGGYPDYVGNVRSFDTSFTGSSTSSLYFSTRLGVSDGSYSSYDGPSVTLTDDVTGLSRGICFGLVYNYELVGDEWTIFSSGWSDNYSNYGSNMSISSYTPSNEVLIVGKLDFNVSGDDDVLHIWVDPTGVETSTQYASITVDVDFTSPDAVQINDICGESTSSHATYADDLLIGTTWADAAGWLMGDADQDGDVDLLDLGVLGENWGSLTGMEWADGDFDGDGDVDLLDLGLLGENWGTGVTGTTGMSFNQAMQTVGVPEPSSLVMLLAATFGFAAFVIRRGKTKDNIMKCLTLFAFIFVFAASSANADIIGSWSNEEIAGGSYERWVLTVTPDDGETMTGFDISVLGEGVTFNTGTAPIFQAGKNEDTSFLLDETSGSPPNVVNNIVATGSMEGSYYIAAGFGITLVGQYSTGWSSSLELLEVIVPTGGKSSGGIDDPYTDLTVSNSITWTGPAQARIGFGAEAVQSDVTMVPEPGTLALLAAGLMGLLCYAWRRRK